jgi:hypothetical protein
VRDATEYENGIVEPTPGHALPIAFDFYFMVCVGCWVLVVWWGYTIK